MPSKRDYLHGIAIAAFGSLTGCAGLLPNGGGSESGPKNCNKNPNQVDKTFEYSRDGQIRASPAESQSDKWPVIEFSNCLHNELQTATRDAHQANELKIYEITANEAEEIKENLYSNFGITEYKFYIIYSDDSIEIRVVQNA